LRGSVKRRSQKAGLPPGTMVPIGGGETEKAVISVIDYDQSNLEEREMDSVEECAGYKDKPTVSWINVDNIKQVEAVAKLGECFGLHPLILEDIVNATQRPKMESFGDYIFMVIKMLRLDEARNAVIAEQVSLVLGRGFVLSFQEMPGDVFDPVRDRLRRSGGRIRRAGADYLAYALLDAVVDNYFSIMEWFDGKLEAMEDRVVANPTSEILQTIHDLKREMLMLKKSLWPLREVVNGLTKTESSLVERGTLPYLRDVYDHVVQLIDTGETLREMIGGMRDTYLSSMSNRMNDIMKVLTIIATIFIPITFVAGVYGMNFEFMPELKWPWGYFATLGLMGGISLVMVIYFKRRGWL
jgi:magnesium transporter